MAKKRNAKTKTASSSSDAEYTFRQARKFAKTNKLHDWEKVLSEENDTNFPEAGGNFAELKSFHTEVRTAGGVREIVTADLDYAKQFCIASQLLALENGFVVSTASELDHAPVPSEQREKSLRALKLKAPESYPGRLFHRIMSNLVFPGGKRGPMHLITLAAKLKVDDKVTLENLEWSEKSPEKLDELIGCDPLVWLLAQYTRKVKVGPVRQKLAIVLSGTDMKKKEIDAFFAPRKPVSDIKWPSMNQHDQADLVCYLLSGISRLLRALEFSGLVVALEQDGIFSDARKEIGRKEPDATKRRRKTTEFEWDMRACFGGLIWSAIAPEASRSCTQTRSGQIARTKCRHCELLKHTGGKNSKTAYPFTTQKPCHLGVLYVTTPKDWGSEQRYQVVQRHESIILPA